MKNMGQNNDWLIDELGDLAMATRLMRLSEWTRKDVTRIYKEHKLDFESKWFPVLYVLSKKKELGVVELANAIGYTHQSIVVLVKEMQAKRLVKSSADKTDGRKRIISLTQKAFEMIAELKCLWEDFRVINSAIYNNGSSLLKAVEDCEAALTNENFYERYKKLEANRTLAEHKYRMTDEKSE